MNLLVTNTRAAQAYFIIRALRPLANKIVATVYGRNFLTARLSHAAASRFIDKRYYVPSPASDWRRGRVDRKNSEREEVYVTTILEICKKEKIDVVFPSWDAQIYVLAKNRERFDEIGILIPVPDYETLVIPFDKYRILQAAEKAGLVCAKTYLPKDLDELLKIVQELGFPIVVKPRYTSWGIEIVTNFKSLYEATHRQAQKYGMPMLQEYIPSGERQDVHLLLDRVGNVKFILPRRARRTLRLDPHAHFSTVHQSTPHPTYTPQAVNLVQELGWWGSATVETVVDPRDHTAKFAEFVPRFRRQLWNTTEMGVNEPWMCIRIAKGEDVGHLAEPPAGVTFLSPLEDFCVLILQMLDLTIYKIRRGISPKASVDLWGRPPSIRELLQSIADSYFCSDKKIIDPYFRYFVRDPAVSILWWLQIFSWMFGITRRLGC